MPLVRTPLFLYAETSLHIGSGSDLGAVDLPIRRERHTGLPIIPGSAIKGPLRADARDTVENQGAGAGGWTKESITAVFGPDFKHADEHAGAAIFPDAQILLFPVRAAGDYFAWLTAPGPLARLRRMLREAGVPVNQLPPQPPAFGDAEALLATGSPLKQAQGGRTYALLEEFAYGAREVPEVAELASWLAERIFVTEGDVPDPWSARLERALVVITDDEFRAFTELATTVATRNKLKLGTKTVEKGQLWTEEYLPGDSVFVTLIGAERPRVQSCPKEWDAEWVLKRVRSFAGRTVQLGGLETTGHGFTRFCFPGVSDAD